MRKIDLTEEIRRITNETASVAAAKALEAAEQAKAKAAEVSALATAEALKAATLAASKAAEAASAAAAIASSTSKDLEYIKKDISDTKLDIKAINEKLDNKYTTKTEFNDHIKEEEREQTELDKTFEKLNRTLDTLVTHDQFSTVKAVVYGEVGLILTSVMGGLMYLLLNK